MTTQQTREYYALRAKLEVCISDLHDEFLIDLLETRITPELSDIICEELRTRAQRLTDAVAGAQDDIPVGDGYMEGPPCMGSVKRQLDDLWADTKISDITMTNQTISLMHNPFKPFNSK
jgi:hypothetical protein